MHIPFIWFEKKNISNLFLLFIIVQFLESYTIKTPNQYLDSSPKYPEVPLYFRVFLIYPGKCVILPVSYYHKRNCFQP